MCIEDTLSSSSAQWVVAVFSHKPIMSLFEHIRGQHDVNKLFALLKSQFSGFSRYFEVTSTFGGTVKTTYT